MFLLLVSTATTISSVTGTTTAATTKETNKTKVESVKLEKAFDFEIRL